jgi:hypothetical protein
VTAASSAFTGNDKRTHLIQANIVAYALARRIVPRHPLSSRGSLVDFVLASRSMAERMRCRIAA